MNRMRSSQVQVFLKLPGCKKESDLVPVTITSGQSQVEQIISAADNMDLSFPYALQYNQEILLSAPVFEQSIQLNPGDIISIVPVLIGG